MTSPKSQLGGKKKSSAVFIFWKLSPCRSVSETTCPHFHTLTLACAASLWSCWLLACLSLSSRSACRVAQREVNPSFSSSRASTTCCRSSSSVRLLSVFISWIKEARARRRAGGHGGPNKQWRLKEMNRKGSDSNREEGRGGGAGETEKKKKPVGWRLRWICKQWTGFAAGAPCTGRWLAKVTSAVWLGPCSQMLVASRWAVPPELGSRRYRGQSVCFNDRLLMRVVHAARPIRLNPGLLWSCPPQFLTTRPHQDCARSIPLSIKHSQVPSKHN